MQITRVEVCPVELKLRQPVRMAGFSPISQVMAVFVRAETRDGRNAWGCGVAHPDLTGETPAHALKICHQAASMVPDLHPTNLEYSLAELSPVIQNSPAAVCAFDLLFHDLLGLIAGIPLYRLLGGYRNRIQTSVTIPLGSIGESVANAQRWYSQGFRMLKVKGGLNPEEDVERIKAIRRALPDVILRLDADGGYSVQQALDVARALRNQLEMLEQPVRFDSFEELRQVTQMSPVPILADQSVSSPESTLALVSERCVHGVSIKVATGGGLRGARQVDAIARAAKMVAMVGCVVEPALLIAAGLSFALSSPNVKYGDLDGNLDLLNDPTRLGFTLQEGWLIASESPGLGCMVELCG
ncbi:MAG TPA: dipeptide epimerase [Anaerolineales bacterium]|nr:dipeptide epimerase [Anaerolineales bacterium]